MEATTAGISGTPGMPAIEVPRVETGTTVESVLKALHHVWWFGLGLAVVTGEQAVKLARTAVDRGRSVEPSLKPPLQKAERGLSDALAGVGTRLKEVGSRLGKGAEAVESAMDERVAAALAHAGAPLMTQMEELKDRVEELTAKVESLQAKRGTNPQAG